MHFDGKTPRPAPHVSATRLSRRRFLVAGSTLAVSGCYGSFGLTDALYQWNGSLENKWIRALVFLGLVIIPVYGLFLMADAIVLNTVEFWTGRHPIGGSARVRQVGDGQTVTSKGTEEPGLVRHEHRRDGQLVRVFYTRYIDEGEVRLYDSQMRLLAVAKQADGDGVEIVDASGRRIGALDGAGLRRAERHVRRGVPVSRVLREVPAAAGWRLAAGSPSRKAI